MLGTFTTYMVLEFQPLKSVAASEFFLNVNKVKETDKKTLARREF